MLEIGGNFWNYIDELDYDSAICCTINTMLKGNGELVMGAGIAKEFAQRYPKLPNLWGNRIADWTKPDNPYILVEWLDEKSLFAVGLPTKFDWRHASPLTLVSRSVRQLVIVAEAMNWKQVLMTRPGCGHGKLNWENEVKPIMAPIMDDRFIVAHEGDPWTI